VCYIENMLLRCTELDLGALDRVCDVHDIRDLRLGALNRVVCVHDLY
jgi:hypothetical protein